MWHVLALEHNHGGGALIPLGKNALGLEEVHHRNRMALPAWEEWILQRVGKVKQYSSHAAAFHVTIHGGQGKLRSGGRPRPPRDYLRT